MSWLLSLGRNLSPLLYLSLVLLLPTQFGKHFWPSFSLVLGLSVDYLSPTLFATDILLFSLLIVFVVLYFFSLQTKRLHKPSLLAWIKKHRLVAGLLLFLLLGAFLSERILLGLVGLVKMVEILFFACATNWFLTTKKRFFPYFFFVLGIGIIFESTLALLHYVTQGSLGGALYFFGERTFTAQTPGIATSAIGGLLMLRPYGTFPHPNVLAGFLVIGMTILLLIDKKRFSTMLQRLILVALGIGSVGLFLTFSRTALFIWVLVLLVVFRRFVFKKRLLFLLFVFLGFIGIVLLPHRLFFSFSEESFVLRKNLFIAAVYMFFDHLFFGTGLRHFLVLLPHYLTQKHSLYYLQPVHNIFLLWIVETGVVGALALVLFFKALIRRMRRTRNLMPFLLIIIVCILGSVDHYFLTLQQGNLLLGLVLGFVWFRTRRILS